MPEQFQQLITNLPELFWQIRTNLPELFRQIRTNLPEQFRQIRMNSPELFQNIRMNLPQLSRKMRSNFIIFVSNFKTQIFIKEDYKKKKFDQMLGAESTFFSLTKKCTFVDCILEIFIKNYRF